MRVLVLHNRYRQYGGEDRAVAAETAMLRAHGVDVIYHEVNNDVPAAQFLLHGAWSETSYRDVEKLCRETRPDVAHVHNFWAVLTPSAHDACHAAGVPTVQTLHNYRLFCPNALLLRNGRICTDCLGKHPWRGVVHRCYNHSFIASAAVARMIVVNRRRHTWDDVDAFIAPSEHARSMFIAGGIAAERLHVKPNFAPDPGSPISAPSNSRTLVYAGRLSEEKGVRTLVAAWARADLGSKGQLIVLGDGPEMESLRGCGAAGLVLKGRQDAAAVVDAIRNARAVVTPSICYETFGNSVVEAYACGRPVIASDIGSFSELVDDGRTGLKYTASDEQALASAMARILDDENLVDSMGEAARCEYLARFTPERNFEILRGLYENVIGRRAGAPEQETVAAR